jgi:ATP-dependent Clp protease ATP-binding subunit ClpA
MTTHQSESRVTPADFAARLARFVRGQSEVLETLAGAVARREHELAPPRGCRDAFLFVGPTGVGKTELARALAHALYGQGHWMRFDASEFALPQSLEVALGDGRGLKGRLASAYSTVPAGVWLFDEIEKGCEAFKDLLIQMTDAGRVTLASGERLDFSAIYIVATSNLGSREILEREHLPFTSLERHVVERLEHWLRPELLARFQTPFVFRPLDWEAQKEITRKRLNELVAWQARRHQRLLLYEDAVVEHLIAAGFSRRHGARPLLRTIDRLVGDAILNGMQQDGAGSGRLAVHGDGLCLTAN